MHIGKFKNTDSKYKTKQNKTKKTVAQLYQLNLLKCLPGRTQNISFYQGKLFQQLKSSENDYM